jgi:hypothetical protein
MRVLIGWEYAEMEQIAYWVLLGLNIGMSEAYEKFLLWLELGWVEHGISTRSYKY